jgi:outer membrane protein assembly factor BamE (lipoprotein component of BamABCDE complex)
MFRITSFRLTSQLAFPRAVLRAPALLPFHALTLVALLALGSCSATSKLSFPGVYRIDIPQGNIITQQMVDQLRPGLTKNQVIFIMGTPLVRDTFHQDRWDYVYSFQPGGGERGQERITVFFENDQLTHFTGDFQQTPENSQFSTATPNRAPSTAQ